MGVYKFETCSAYFRTYHNVTADALTRKAKAEVAELLKAKELKQVGLEQAWTDHLSRDWIRRAFTWRGQDESLRKLALQLADSRTPDEVPRLLARPVPGVGFRAIEWRGTLGHYAAAAALAGATARMVAAPGARTRGRYAGL